LNIRTALHSSFHNCWSGLFHRSDAASVNQATKSQPYKEIHGYYNVQKAGLTGV